MLRRYSKGDTPAVQLEGPSTEIGTPHYNATQSQRVATERGTYGAERAVAYDALIKAGIPSSTATTIVQYSDAYFTNLGVNESTPTRIPGERK